jgi:hypothetical protein
MPPLRTLSRFFRVVGSRPRRVVFPRLRHGLKELRFTFSPATSATAVLGAGDAAILATAKTAGVVGNALTAAIVIEPDSTALSVAETDGNIVVSSGDKRIMRVTADFGDGVKTVDLVYVTQEGGKAAHELDLSIVDYKTRWASGAGVWVIEENGSDRFESSEDVSTPDLVTTWTPVSPATGTPTVTAAPATAAQAIAVDQSALSVNLTLPDGSDGSAPLAAVTDQPLTGGADPTRVRI